MKILTIGSSNTDLTVHIANMPKPGETVLGRDFTIGAGGKGANQAVGAARLGAEVTFSCMVGDDENGRRSIEGYRKEKIDTSYIFVHPEAPSGVAMILVDGKGENCIVVDSGANGRFRPDDVDKIGALEKFDIALAQLEIPLETVEHAADLCSAAGVRFVLNPAPARKLPESLLAKTDIITPNETEAEILTGIQVSDSQGAEAAAKALCAKGVKSVIITLGCKGAYLYSEGRGRLARAYKVDAVDTTAAGDIFNAALCVALGSGKGLDEAAKFASAASAIAVTRKGAQSSIPNYDEVTEFIETHQND